MTQQWNSNQEDDVQTPLGVGMNAETEFTSEGPGKPKMNSATLVLFGSFALALIIIYLLGMQNKPRSASAQQMAHDQEVQSAIQELLAKNGKAGEFNGLFQNTDRFVKMFYSYLDSQKESTPELSHDPFANDDAKNGPASVDDTVLVPTNILEAEKLRKVAEVFSGLKLQSVMVGRTSVAMINNRMVTVGAKIGELTVAAIEPSRVLMNYGKSKFELKLIRSDAEQQ